MLTWGIPKEAGAADRRMAEACGNGVSVEWRRINGKVVADLYVSGAFTYEGNRRQLQIAMAALRAGGRSEAAAEVAKELRELEAKHRKKGKK